MTPVTSQPQGRNPLSVRSLLIAGSVLFYGCNPAQSFSPRIRTFEPLQQPKKSQDTCPQLQTRIGPPVLLSSNNNDNDEQNKAGEFKQKDYKKVKNSLHRALKENFYIAQHTGEFGSCLSKLSNVHRDLRYQVLALLYHLDKVEDSAELNTQVKRITTRISLAPVVVNVDRLNQEIDSLLEEEKPEESPDSRLQTALDDSDQSNKFHTHSIVNKLRTLLSLKEEYHKCLTTLQAENKKMNTFLEDIDLLNVCSQLPTPRWIDINEDWLELVEAIELLETTDRKPAIDYVKKQLSIPNYVMQNLDYSFNNCFTIDPDLTGGEQVLCGMEISCPAVYQILTGIFSRDSLRAFIDNL